MSKQERQRPYIFGRVFFPGTSNPVPIEIRFQPLGNHVGNVRRLVKHWQDSDFPCESSFKRVLKAADIHDVGKPQKFSILVETNSKGKFRKYIYSFRGHRFLAESKDEWAQALARGHHDFSVEDISRDAYKLKNLKKEQQDNDTLAESYAKILGNNPLAYARELYILEMCDQIEAELACRVLGDEDQAESRTFMDYTIAKDDSDESVYLIDPWPFKKDSIELTFEYWSMQPTAEDKVKLLSCQEDNRDRELGSNLDKIVKAWWQSQPGKPELQPSRKATLKPYPSVDTFKNLDCQSLYQLLAGFEPNPMQAQMFKAIANNDYPAILLKGPTGCGKTESVLFPALAKGYRLFLPLPARSLLEDQKERIEKYLKKFSGLPENKDREFSIVVDTGSQMHRWIYKNGEDFKLPQQINPRRHLYKGDVILTTLDKFIYRYFGFGDKQKSFTFPLRIHRDKTHDEKTIICFDEAHSYDNISFTNFQSLVQSLYEAGRSLILMTATMPQEDIERFDYLDVIDYIDDSENAARLRQFLQQALKQPYPDKRGFQWLSHIEHNPDTPELFQKEFANIVLREWQAKGNRRIIAVVQTVKDAAAIYQRLIQELSSNPDTQEQFLFLYHGRIADQLRPALYNKLKKRDEACQPYILITTSAIEVGCDLNSEVLISQICPPENLIQRAGRCNRRGNAPDAKVVLVGNFIPEFANSLDELGWQNYQQTLRSLKRFDTSAISQCISRSQQVDDYRVVELFSMLHDYVYGADLTCKPAHEKGLVITRSWTPSATLVYDDGTHGDKIQDMPQVTVPIDRLIKKESNQYANAHVYERYYNQEETRWSLRSLRYGSAYLKDIIIKLASNNEGAKMFDGYQEYKYVPELGFVDLPGVFIKLKTTGFDEKLLCQHDKDDKQKSAIITYTKALDSEIDPRS